jgi:hypothetical protein
MCLIADCDSPEYSRGLCYNHYRQARKRVKANKTTWKLLIKEGQAREFIPDKMRNGHYKKRDTAVYIEKSEIALLYQNVETRVKKIEGHLARVRAGYSGTNFI